MKWRTLRRKLQKKKKHNVYGRCPKCGNRTERKLTVGSANGIDLDDVPFLVRECHSCDYVQHYGWGKWRDSVEWYLGEGKTVEWWKGRHIPPTLI